MNLTDGNTKIDSGSSSYFNQWSKYSLPYKDLSLRLKKVRKSHGLKRILSTRTLDGETKTFAEILDSEVEKIVLFFMSTKGTISNKILDTRSSQTSMTTIEEADEFIKIYRKIISEILDLLRYLEANVSALRRILRKHDRLFDVSMLNMYFDSRLDDSSDRGQLLQLYNQEDLRALVSTLKRGMEEAYDLKREAQGEEAVNEQFFRGPSLGSGGRRPSFVVIPHASKNFSYSDVLRAKPPTLTGLNKSANHLLDLRRRKESAIVKSRSISELEPLLRDVEQLSNKFTPKTRSLDEQLMAHSDMAIEAMERRMNRISTDEDSDSDTDVESALSSEYKEQPSDLPHRQTGPEVMLILVSTFLFMTNVYVVAPTSAEYADQLGQTPSMSALIIGMSPLAAMVSAYVYSAWSNYDFRSPLIYSTIVLIIGNYLYGAALQYNSSIMILLGRLLTGFGAARVICRRYIIDHVAIRYRNEASRNFVTAGALGLAFGPLLSSFIARANLKFTIKIRDFVLIRYEIVTAPGWVMFFAWTVFLIFAYVGFTDPLRSRLKSAPKSNGWFQSGKKITPEKSNYSYGAIQEVVAIENFPPEECAQNGSECSLESIGATTETEKLYSSYIRPSSINNSWNDNSSNNYKNESRESCLSLISLEVYIILVVYFVNRVGQEVVVSSAPLLTSQLFNWSPEASGYFMAFSGSLVLPFNILSAKFFNETEERRTLLILTFLCMIFTLLTCAYPFVEYSSSQYMLGTILLFGALNSVEGTIMSLLANLVSPALADSTFNSGLLSTEAGTLGRVVGDGMIYIFGVTDFGADLINALFAPFVLTMLATLICLHYFYERLQ